MSRDYEIAVALQSEFNSESSNAVQPEPPAGFLNSTQNLVHPEWENVDPTPDVHKLFAVFSRKFFQNKLVCVTLEWSKRMYQCAGICYQRKSRVGMECTIRLSEPLLKLRSRKDLVETLLHEMIHAYCFVLGIQEGNGGHGPSFIKLMSGINRLAGTNITVYHNFQDEVNLYKTHWWRCDGVCQNRKPYHGFVKRTCNRAPSPNDFWFLQHQQTCGGKFIKVKGPEPKKPVKGKENTVGSGSKTKPSDIRKFFTNNEKPIMPQIPKKNPISSTPSSTVTPNRNTKNYKTGGATKPNFGGNTVVVRKPPTNRTVRYNSPPKPIPQSPTSHQPKISTIFDSETSKSGGLTSSQPATGGNLTNVRQMKDLNSSDSAAVNKKPIGYGTSGGQKLGGSGCKKSRLLDDFPEAPKKKKARVKSNNDDSDLQIINIPTEIISIESDEEDAEKPSVQDEKEAFIKSMFEDDDFKDIVLIDNEYDDNYLNDGNDNLIANSTVTDTSVIDDLFDADTLLDNFRSDLPDENSVVCPLCMRKVMRAAMEEHLESCASMEMTQAADISTPQPGTSSAIVFDSPQPSTSTGISNSRRHKVPKTVASQKSIDITDDAATTDEANKKLELDILRSCGYTEEDIQKAYSSPETQSQKDNKEVAVAVSTIIADDDDFPEINLADHVDFLDELKPCPVCNIQVSVKEMNGHLDACLQGTANLLD